MVSWWTGCKKHEVHTTYPQFAHNVVKRGNFIVFLSRRNTKGFRQICHEMALGGGEFLECYCRTGTAGKVPDPNDKLSRIFDAQKRILQANMAAAWDGVKNRH